MHGCRGTDASPVWSRGYSRCADDLRLVIARTWERAGDQAKAAEKLRLSGAITCQDLVQLMEARAPREDAHLPTSSFFRGQACLLNYRIHVNGGKLLKSATMETLHKLASLPSPGIDSGSRQVPHSLGAVGYAHAEVPTTCHAEVRTQVALGVKAAGTLTDAEDDGAVGYTHAEARTATGSSSASACCCLQ